jgi:hypothetical protein
MSKGAVTGGKTWAESHSIKACHSSGMTTTTSM